MKALLTIVIIAGALVALWLVFGDSPATQQLMVHATERKAGLVNKLINLGCDMLPMILFVIAMLCLGLYANLRERRRMADYYFVQKHGMEAFRDVFGRDPGD